MFGFIKQIFISALIYFANLSSVNSLKCVSLKNKESKVRPEIVDINSNNPIFYPFSIKVNKCNDNCININNPCAKICVLDTVKNLNVKVFNLMSRIIETRHIKWHELFKCICRLDKVIYNSKQRWNEINVDECKELIDKEVCDKEFIWNPSNWECECDKSCSISEYLDYSNCKCRKKLVDPLVEECTENIDEIKLVNITVENENKDRCSFSIVHNVLFWIFFIFFIINSGIIIYFVYLKYVNRIKYDLPY